MKVYELQLDRYSSKLFKDYGTARHEFEVFKKQWPQLELHALDESRPDEVDYKIFDDRLNEYCGHLKEREVL